jgi:selenocysteine lyase/cysteine desulfurase
MVRTEPCNAACPDHGLIEISALEDGMAMTSTDTATPVFPTWHIQASRSAALAELERRVGVVLSTYSNVHRGSGHYACVTTALYDRARQIALEAMGLDATKHVVVFTSPTGARTIRKHVATADVKERSSEELGLPLGVRALGIDARSLPQRVPFHSGGGTARLVSPQSIIRAAAPERFEPGTPGIVNVVTFACALRMQQRFGRHVVGHASANQGSVAEVFYGDRLTALSGMPLLRALRTSLLGWRSHVPVTHGTRPYLHLDNAASTPALASVWQSVQGAWRQPEAWWPDIVREVRCICADFLGAERRDYGVVFVANTTEAINALASSVARSVPDGVRPVIVNSLLEHNSNELPWRDIPNASTVRLSIDDEGFLDLAELERVLREYNEAQQHGNRRVRLVAVSGCSNVLGSSNDLEAIARLAHRYGAQLFVDAAQLVAHRKIDMAQSEIDWLAFSGHKAYAPFGAGVLVARRTLLAETPELWETLNASGEENVVGVTALGKALLDLQRVGMGVIESEERRLTQLLLDGLSELPDVEVFGVRERSSLRMQQRGGIVAFTMAHVPHNLVADELARHSAIGVRTGCHCAHLLVKRLFGISCVRAKVADLGITLFPALVESMLPGLVRVSLGIGNDDSDVALLLQTLRTIEQSPRTRWERSLASRRNAFPLARSARTGEPVDTLVNATMAAVYPTARCPTTAAPAPVTSGHLSSARNAAM